MIVRREVRLGRRWCHAAGLRAVAFLWIALLPGASAPGALKDRLTLADADGHPERITTTVLPIAPDASGIALPVRGCLWVGVRGPSNTSGYRLSSVTLAGKARVPQRFAVDWTLPGTDRLPFHGDRTEVANWYSYGTPVYAVAAGTVAWCVMVPLTPARLRQPHPQSCRRRSR